MPVLEYAQREPSPFAAWLRRARSFLLLGTPILAFGLLGGLVASRFPPTGQYTSYWAIKVPNAGPAFAAYQLNDSLGPSPSFAPLAVRALRAAGLAQGETDQAVRQRVFLFVRRPQTGSSDRSIQVGFTAPDSQASERGARIVAAEIGKVLDSKGLQHSGYPMTSWAYDDGGGPTPRIALGAGAGSFVGFLVAFGVCRAMAARRD